MKNSLEIRRLAKKLFDYHYLGHKLKRADCILVFGSRDLRVAERGIQLFFENRAPLLVFSGGFGRLSAKNQSKPEANIFAELALQRGVPKGSILIENKSSNTGENILFSKKLFFERGINPQVIIFVQIVERRTYATFKKLWPEKEIIAASPQISFEEYLNRFSENEAINLIVGETCRIKIYPQKGFSIPQEIPDDVRSAYEQLIFLGYNKYLI